MVEYSQEDYALNELAQTIAGKLPQEVVKASLQRQATVAAHDTGYSLK